VHIEAALDIEVALQYAAVAAGVLPPVAVADVAGNTYQLGQPATRQLSVIGKARVPALPGCRQPSYRRAA